MRCGGLQPNFWCQCALGGGGVGGLEKVSLWGGGGVEVETTVLLRGSLGLAVQCEEVNKGYC